MSIEVKLLEDAVQYNIPKDMKKGVRHGLLVLTGEYITDNNQNRKYYSVCDCGVVVIKSSRETRKTKCCSVRKHTEYFKKGVRKPKPPITDVYKERYVGKTIHNHVVLDVVKYRSGHSFKLKCLKCGRTVNRKMNKFLKTGIGCTFLTEKERLDKIKQAKEHRAKARKDKIKKNGGVVRYKDLTGQRRGNLTVLKYIGTTKNSTNKKLPTFKCKCDCGGMINLTSNQLSTRTTCDKEYIEAQRQKAINTNNKKKAQRLELGIEVTSPFRKQNKGKFKDYSRAIYDKYHGVCQKCKKYHSKRVSEAHHIIPVNKKPELSFLLSNGILLCNKCHIKFHEKYGYIDFNPQSIFKYINSNTETIGAYGEDVVLYDTVSHPVYHNKICDCGTPDHFSILFYLLDTK